MKCHNCDGKGEIEDKRLFSGEKARIKVNIIETPLGTRIITTLTVRDVILPKILLREHYDALSMEDIGEFVQEDIEAVFKRS